MSMRKKDSELQKDIVDELQWEPAVVATDIGVIVKDGAVTLTGTVPTYADKLAAKRATRRIAGVHAIADEIEVKLPAEMLNSDEEIAHRIANMLSWSTEVSGDAIKAEVHDGYVTLLGEVDWQYQRKAIQKKVEGMRGIKSVANAIILRKRAEARDVKKEIIRALHRHADMEATRIRVSVQDGTVTLSGSVENDAEKKLAEHAAWAAAGISNVVDNLRIER